MRSPYLLAAALVMAAPTFAADRPGVGSGFRPPIPVRPSVPHAPILPRDFIVYDREVVVEKQVEVEKKEAPPAPVAPAPPAEKRKPYALGNVYGSLPGSCMKMIEDGASYYHCNGEWYQQVAGGQYKAVKAP